MQVHTLDVGDLDEDYALLGIHTVLEDYKLAYLLNKTLKTQFVRTTENLEFNANGNKTAFSLYFYADSNYDFDWHLIANSSKSKSQSVNNNILLASEIKSYVIPEKKNIDFFLKLSGYLPAELLSEIQKKINTIAQIVTCYAIDKNTLKSKDYLIF